MIFSVIEWQLRSKDTDWTKYNYYSCTKPDVSPTYCERDVEISCVTLTCVWHPRCEVRVFSLQSSHRTIFITNICWHLPVSWREYELQPGESQPQWGGPRRLPPGLAARLPPHLPDVPGEEGEGGGGGPLWLQAGWWWSSEPLDISCPLQGEAGQTEASPAVAHTSHLQHWRLGGQSGEGGQAGTSHRPLHQSGWGESLRVTRGSHQHRQDEPDEPALSGLGQGSLLPPALQPRHSHRLQRFPWRVGPGQTHHENFQNV